MNLRSCCTKFPSNEGVASTKKIYESCIHETLPTKVIATFLALILTSNNFLFSSKFYLQIKVVMVTICALTFENIVMAEFKQKTNQYFSYAILMMFLLYGPNLKNS